jgi:hypothetical protein
MEQISMLFGFVFTSVRIEKVLSREYEGYRRLPVGLT